MNGRDSFIDAQRARSLGLGAPAPVRAPVLRPGEGGPMPYRPDPGAATRGGACAAERVQLAGGALNSLMVHPFITPFEQLYRRLPEEGMFDPQVSPQRPFAFELGAFQVPDRFALCLFDLRPDIYRLSGLDAGDFVPVEARRFSSIMGFEITIDQRHTGNTQFQLDPIAIQATAQAFTRVVPPGTPTVPTVAGIAAFDAPVPPPPPSVFNIAAANSFANAAGAGTALQPQRPTRYGPLSVPFMLVARSKQTVQVRCVIFRRVPSPIAFIEYDIAGMLFPTDWLDAMMECLKPVEGLR